MADASPSMDRRTPAQDDLRRNGRYRRYHAPLSVKHVTFQGDSLVLARRIEAKAQVERVSINDLLLHLLRRGFEAESRGTAPGDP
jgi:hypothetical protein